jgi:hypothetical protein
VRVEGLGLPVVLRTVVADAAGAFTAEDLPDGEYRVLAKAPDHTPGQESVTIVDSVPASVTVRLAEESATVLVVREADGTPAESLIVLSSQGGMTGPTLYVLCTEAGRCELDQLPAGPWTLLVSSRGAALVLVSSPSGEVPVTLRPRGQLVVHAPQDAAGAAWQVRVTEAASGLAVPTSEWRNPGRTEWAPVPAGGYRPMLPEGRYRVEAYAPDGTATVHDVTLPGGGTAELIVGE